ncbi:DUF2752 domain-containing protein [Polaribacter sp. IC066]|nr:DUF2752 domain-containing protein [Polaribacter sp. IC066]
MNFNLEEYMLPCFSKTFFGFDCLGCGLQRSLLLLINGNFIDAFKMYPAIFTLLALFLFILLNFKAKFKQSKKIISSLAYLNVSIMVLSYLIKINL